MAYLSCPKCRLTVFDRNPLISPRQCPRCARRGTAVELERRPRTDGAAAASLLESPRRPATASGEIE